MRAPVRAVALAGWWWCALVDSAQAAPPRPTGSASAASSAAKAAGKGAAQPLADAGTDLSIYRPARPAFRWEFPAILSEVDVPEVFETNGIPVRFRALVLGMPFEQCYLHFRESFMRQGLYVAPPSGQLPMGPGQVSLTGMDPDTENTYTVIFTLYDNGTTGAIVGEAGFKGRQMTPQNPFFPLMAGADGLVTQQQESGRSMGYRLRAQAPAVMTFYGQVLRDRGYVQQKDGVWTRGSSAVRVVAEPSDESPEELDVVLLEFSTPSDDDR